MTSNKIILVTCLLVYCLLILLLILIFRPQLPPTCENADDPDFLSKSNTSNFVRQSSYYNTFNSFLNPENYVNNTGNTSHTTNDNIRAVTPKNYRRELSIGGFEHFEEESLSLDNLNRNTVTTLDFNTGVLNSGINGRIRPAQQISSNLNQSVNNGQSDSVNEYMSFLNKKSNLLGYFDALKRCDLNSVVIHISRKNVLKSSYHELMNVSVLYYQKKRLEVKFNNEMGFDTGGLSREWLNIFINDITLPLNNFFKLVNESDGTLIPSNKLSTDSFIFSDMYRLLGRIMGYIIILDSPINTNINLIVFKQILKEECTLEDFLNLETSNYFLNIKNWEDVHRVFENDEGEELKPNGLNIKVTANNCNEFIFLYLKNKYYDQLTPAVDLIRKGLFEVIGKTKIEKFKAWELDLLINGQKMIDIENWKQRTIYDHYNSKSEIIIWFWECVYELSETDRVKLLQYITAYTQLPVVMPISTVNIGGNIRTLNLTNNNRVMTIKRVLNKDLFPASRTCGKILELPHYGSKDILREKLRFIINQDYIGFYVT